MPARTRRLLGYVRLQAEAEDDMYHIFNLAMAGDKMTASTMRNVVHETKTGSVTKNRVRIQLKITIEEVMMMMMVKKMMKMKSMQQIIMICY